MTRVVSVAAHGLDVALTLGRPAWTEPPAGLGWDDGTLLAVATGRRGLGEEERALLGPAWQRFPLLS